MTMKERQARIVGYEVNLGRLVARNVDHILENPRCAPSCNLGQFKGMPVQMDRMRVSMPERVNGFV